MLVFINTKGDVVYRSPGGIYQGSVEANEIKLVCPFPAAFVTLSFQLPNGIVLGPKVVADLPETANEYVMTAAGDIPGYHVDGTALHVYTYKCSRELTAISGNLGVQFYITVGTLAEGEEGTALLDGYTVSTERINIPVYNGTRFIPNIKADEADIGQLISLVTALVRDAVMKNPDDTSATQAINSPVRINDTLNVGQTMSVGEGLTLDRDSISYLLSLFMRNSDGFCGLDISYTEDLGEANSDGRYNASNGLIIKGIALSSDVEGNPKLKIIVEGSAELKGDLGIGGSLDVAEFLNVRQTMSVEGRASIKELAVDEIEKRSASAQAININDNIVAKKNLVVYGDFSASTASASSIETEDLNVSGQANFTDELNAYMLKIASLIVSSNAAISGNLDIEGDFNVKGTFRTVDQETIAVKDNIIVTNSGGQTFSTSGIVIRISTEEYDNAYGILYDPSKDAVCVGLGTVGINDETQGYEFQFSDGQGIPLAARDGNFSEGDIPVWDAGKNAFKPSGKTADSFVKKTTQTTGRIAYINEAGVDKTLRIIYDADGESTYGGYYLACRNKEGCITVNDPINPLDSVNKRTMEAALAWKKGDYTKDLNWLRSAKPSEVYIEFQAWNGSLSSEVRAAHLIYDGFSYFGNATFYTYDDATGGTVIESITGKLTVSANKDNADILSIYGLHTDGNGEQNGSGSKYVFSSTYESYSFTILAYKE